MRAYVPFVYAATLLGIALLTEHRVASASESDDVTVATWEFDLTTDIKSSNALVHRDGSMVLETRYSDGSSSAERVPERPADQANERKFVLAPDTERSEYFVLTASGYVKYFSWEGREFAAVKAMHVHPNLMTIGVNPVTPECVSKTLSKTSKEVIELYKQLHAFKDEPEFAARGFALTGPYYPWLESAKNLQAKPGLQSFRELGFLPGELVQLGLEYMSAATTGSGSKHYIEDMERTIRAGVAEATRSPG